MHQDKKIAKTNPDSLSTAETTKPPPDGTTTKQPSDETTTKPSTTTVIPKDDSNVDDPDEKAFRKLINDRSDELALIQKAWSAYGRWMAWLKAHDYTTLNRFLVSSFWRTMSHDIPPILNGRDPWTKRKPYSRETDEWTTLS